jgi:hypothetical protein
MATNALKSSASKWISLASSPAEPVHDAVHVDGADAGDDQRGLGEQIRPLGPLGQIAGLQATSDRLPEIACGEMILRQFEVSCRRRAGRDRLTPIMLAHPTMREEMVALVVLRQDDGAEQSILIVQSPECLPLAKDLVMFSELLPDDDAALLPGPDRVGVYTVVKVAGTLDQNTVLDGERS